jgi:hypothetical protein
MKFRGWVVAMETKFKYSDCRFIFFVLYLDGLTEDPLNIFDDDLIFRNNQIL